MISDNVASKATGVVLPVTDVLVTGLRVGQCIHPVSTGCYKNEPFLCFDSVQLILLLFFGTNKNS